MNYCEKCMRPLEEGELCPTCGFLSAAPLHHIRPGTNLRKKYVVGRAFEEDSMVISYLARDLSCDRVVILQEFFPEGQVVRNHLQSNTVAEAHFQEKAMERFLEKARILSEYAEEPCVMQVLDYFRDNNTAYMVTERADGISIRRYLEKKGVLPASALLQLLQPAMQTLDALHERGLIHRKINPENVMLYPDGNIKLVGFGTAAKTVDANAVSSYVPPEQYKSSDYCGPWSDVYSLCATLYKSITGIDPQPAMERLIVDTMKRPSELGIAMDERQEEVLMMGLALEKSRRLQSVKAMLCALGIQQEEKIQVEDVPTTVRREQEYKEPAVFVGMPVLEEADENAERPIDPVENHGKMSAESEPAAEQPHGQLTIPAVMMEPMQETQVISVQQVANAMPVEEPTAVFEEEPSPQLPVFEAAPMPKAEEPELPIWQDEPEEETVAMFEAAPMPKTMPVFNSGSVPDMPVFEQAPAPVVQPIPETMPAFIDPVPVEPAVEEPIAVPQTVPDYAPWNPQVGDYDTWNIPEDDGNLWQPEVPVAPKKSHKKTGLIIGIVALVVVLAGLVGLFFWLRNEKGMFGGSKGLENLCFELDGESYELPVKLSVLCDEGWEPEDDLDALEAGKDMSFNLYKDGQEVCVVILNAEKDELPAEDCTVVCLYVCADEAKLELDGGISTQSKKKEAQEALGKGEEVDGALYYENKDGAVCLYLEQKDEEDNRISIATEAYINNSK